MSTGRTQVQLVNMHQSSCKMILQFRFDESVYVVTYINEIICRGNTEKWNSFATYINEHGLFHNLVAVSILLKQLRRHFLLRQCYHSYLSDTSLSLQTQSLNSLVPNNLCIKSPWPKSTSVLNFVCGFYHNNNRDFILIQRLNLICGVYVSQGFNQCVPIILL